MFNAEEDDLKFIPEVIPFQLLFAAGHSLQRLKEHFALLIFISLDWAVSSILSCVWRVPKTYAPSEWWVAAAQMNGLDSLSPACGLVLPLFSWLFILFTQAGLITQHVWIRSDILSSPLCCRKAQRTQCMTDMASTAWRLKQATARFLL